MGNFIAGCWNLITSGLGLVLTLVWLVARLGFSLLIPAANYFIYKSQLKPNIKLMYISVFTLLLLTAITIIKLVSKPTVKGFQSVFDPELAFYDTVAVQSDGGSSRSYISEMGLDTCVDPDGNIIDLAKRFRSDHSWILFETPNEYHRKESIEHLAKRGSYSLHKLSTPLSPSDSANRHNQIKLEDFRFLDVYLRREKLKQARHTAGKGVLYFDLDGLSEEAFDSFTQTVIEYQKVNEDNPWSVLFSTADNHLSNHLSSRFSM